jgi:hypothetical protein
VVDRVRPLRRRLIPKEVFVYSAAALGALVLVAVVVGYVSGKRMMPVPDVVGLEEPAAMQRLEELGLAGEVVERLFNPAPAGTVLEQTPDGGSELTEGSAVQLVVSAGTEEFELPDVLGVNVRIARAQLEERGLVVKIDTIESDLPSDTVVMTNPSPGATVRTSDIVRLTVSGQGSATSALLPYPLDNTSFVIDPSDVPPGSIDAPAEVARRLQSLLEASGAQVLITRSANSTDTTEMGRASVVTGTWTAVVGLDVSQTGDPGLAVLTLSTGQSPAIASASAGMAEALISGLGRTGADVSTGQLEQDQVLLLSGSAGVRVRLGSASDPADASAFRDPAWSDELARVVYQAIGERFGTR